MERRTTSWFSQNLSTEMPLVAYGHGGPPLLMFPTAAADYLEYERFYLVDAIKSFIEAGKLRAYSINSVNRYSLLNEQMPAPLKAELLTRYDRYIVDEVLPLIRKDCGDGENRPLTTGTLVRKRPPAKRNTADPSEAVPSSTEAPPGASRTDSSLAEGARRRGGASGEGAERASSWRTVRRARMTGVQAARATAATARRAGTRRTRWPCTARHTA